MKKCSYCGTEYPDDLAICPVDQMKLDKTHPMGEPTVASTIKRKIPIHLSAKTIRIIASMLAIGGLFWGLFCLPFFFAGNVQANRWHSLLIFGPGYIVTFGYFMRCFSTPRLSIRRAIWLFSLLVQGAWLACYLWCFAQGPAWFGFLFGVWWLFAFTLSLVGLFSEPYVTSA